MIRPQAVEHTATARNRQPSDKGSVLLLIIGYALVLAALTVVLIDISSVFLARRALTGATDGAAIAGAQALDEATFYTAESLDAVPLAAMDAREAVERYTEVEELAERFPGLSPLAVTSDGQSVSVTAMTLVRLPVLGVLAGGWAAGVPVTVTASARAPFVR